MTERARLRRRAGLTQVQLQGKTGVPAPRLCLWEHGEIELRPEQIARIARVLYEQLSEPVLFHSVAELTQALEHING